MKKSTYMDRALRSSDPRYATILGKLGYSRTDIVSIKPEEKPEENPERKITGKTANEILIDEISTTEEASSEEDISKVRNEYKLVVGRAPFYGWDVKTLREKIEKAKT